jgi:hypothetical protein
MERKRPRFGRGLWELLHDTRCHTTILVEWRTPLVPWSPALARWSPAWSASELASLRRALPRAREHRTVRCKAQLRAA